MKDTTLVFLKQDDQILLAMKKRGFGEGRWNGIGGKVEPSESSQQAAVRETEEEIGVTITEYNQVAEIEFDQYFKGEHALMRIHVYFATSWSGEPTESDEMRPRWYSINNLPFDSMWADDPYWLPLVLAGKKIKAFFKMDLSDNIVSHSIEEVTRL